MDKAKGVVKEMLKKRLLKMPWLGWKNYRGRCESRRKDKNAAQVDSGGYSIAVKC